METDNTKEVKEFIDKEEVTPTEDTELVNEGEDQLDSSQEKTETETEEAEDAEETEQSEEEEETEEGSEEIKSVEGETARERALRLEITRMKREVSKYRKDDLFTPVEKPKQTNTILENYDPEQVKELKTILAEAADELGFVKKDELHAVVNTDKRDEIWDSFLDKHPEYLLENDPEGAFYNQLKEEFAIYKEPSTARGFQNLLNKAHESIFGKSSPLNLKKINAQQEKIKIASHSGGTAGSKFKTSKPTNVDNLRVDALKGFSEEEINELFS